MDKLHCSLRDGPSNVSASCLLDAVEDLANKLIYSQEIEIARLMRDRFNDLTKVLTLLADVEFLPYIPEIRITSRIRRPRRGTRTPCLAEITPTGRSTLPIPDGLSVDAHARAILELNVRRMDALRSCAERDLQECWEIFQAGQAALTRTDLPSISEVDALFALAPRNGVVQGKTGYHAMRSHLFPPNDRERSLATLLHYVVKKYGGEIRINSLPSAVVGLIDQFGGAKGIVRFLEGTPVALTATYTIVLIDTAMSGDAAYRLAANPFVGTVKRGCQEIIQSQV